MPRARQVLLEIDGVVAEEGLGLAAGDRIGVAELVRVAGDAHAAAAAAAGGLDQDRIADALGGLERRLDRGDRAVGIGHGRQAEPPGGVLRLHLVAHEADMLGRGADEGEAVLLHHRGKVGILGEEAEPGVDRVGVGDGGGGQDRRHVEIALARRGGADADRFVGEADMHRIGIGRRMHRHRLDAHLAAGPQDAQRDFAAVGDQDLLEHGRGRSRRQSRRISGCPNSTGPPSSTSTARTVPGRGAVIGFITFIASTIIRVWPAATRSPG